jgi:hypothetical protein
MADGSHKNLEYVVVNDWVRTGPETSQVARVGEVFRRTSDRLHEMEFELPHEASKPAPVRVTAEHLVWIDGQGWQTVSEVRAGDWVFDEQGRRLKVAANRLLPGTFTVHTLQLKGDNAFYAGGILVHDLCGPLPPDASSPTPEVAP